MNGEVACQSAPPLVAALTWRELRLYGVCGCEETADPDGSPISEVAESKDPGSGTSPAFVPAERTTTDMPPQDPDRPSRRRYARLVRTTLKIDDDVLEAAWCVAADEGVSVGEVISRLARRGLEPRQGERTRRRSPVGGLLEPRVVGEVRGVTPSGPQGKAEALPD